MDEIQDARGTPRGRKTAGKIVVDSVCARRIGVVTEGENRAGDIGDAVGGKQAVDELPGFFIAAGPADRNVTGANHHRRTRQWDFLQ